MYASQIWATPYLRQGKEMDNPKQKWLLTVLKRTLGVRPYPLGTPLPLGASYVNVV